MDFNLAYAVCLLLCPFIPKTDQDEQSPLSFLSKEWNNGRYKAANTAKGVSYMSRQEQEVVHVLNLARMNPGLFAKTVLRSTHRVSSLVETNNEYYRSLVMLLDTMKSLPVLMPDAACAESASCHALSAGKAGYIGHERQSPTCREKIHYRGECCNYGTDNPIEIVLLLLIDKGVPGLGHRKICLGSYDKVGVAMAPHTSYRYNTVIDFY